MNNIYFQELRSNPDTCNAGKKWYDNDDELLVKLMNENKPYEEIAFEFKRTIGSIRARVIDKIILKEYDGENIQELARKYNFDDSEYLEKCIKARIQKNNISIIDKETYEERKEKNKQKKIERKEIKAAGGEKYYNLLLNIVERLERIEKKLDGYDFTE